MIQGASKAVSDESCSQQVARGGTPDEVLSASSSAPPPASKLPEVAYHDDSWTPTGIYIARSCPPQAPPSQRATLSLPYQTWPGYSTPIGTIAVQNFPFTAQSQPFLTPSNVTTSGLCGPQIAVDTVEPQHYTTQSQEQEYGEYLRGYHGMSPYNQNRP
jgi:hypothetical protein